MVVARLAIVLTLLAARCAAATEAEARLELPENIPAGATVQARLVVTNGAQVASYALPEVQGLTLEQSVSFHQFSNINGRTEETLVVALRADTPGTYRIPAMTVHLRDRTTLTTAPAEVRVGAGNPKLAGFAYGETSFDPATIVPGESTTLRYKLYLRRGADAEDVDVKPPEGTIVIGNDKGTRTHGSAYDLRGEEWQLVTTAWQVTADQPGTIEAGGQQAIEIRRGAFDTSSREIAVRPGHLTVLSLPAAGRPADFSGLVGPVELSATLERERISAGEGTALRVELHGALATHAHPPRLDLPHGIRAYPKDTVDDDEKRVFSWDLVPDAPGTYTIPGPSLPWFDPEHQRYRRAESAPLTLTVVPGRNRDLAISGGPAPAPSGIPKPEPAAEPPPAPLRSGGGFALPPASGPAALLAGLLAGLLAALAPRARRALHRPQHRGRALAAALAAGNLDEAAAALERLRPSLGDPAQREAAARLRDALDAARFGGGALPPAARELASRLEELP